MTLVGIMDRANRGVGKFIIGLRDGSSLSFSRFTLIGDDSGERAQLHDYKVRIGGVPSDAKEVEVRIDAIDWIAELHDS